MTYERVFNFSSQKLRGEEVGHYEYISDSNPVDITGVRRKQGDVGLIFFQLQLETVKIHRSAEI